MWSALMRLPLAPDPFHYCFTGTTQHYMTSTLHLIYVHLFSLILASHHRSLCFSSHSLLMYFSTPLSSLYMPCLLSYNHIHLYHSSPLMFSPHVSVHVFSPSLLFSPLFTLPPHLPLLLSCHIPSHNVLKRVVNFSLWTM